MNNELYNNSLVTKFDNKTLQDCNEYKDSFLQKNNLENFIMREENWVKNNLTFIYSKESCNVQLRINPYYQLINCSIEDNGSTITREYILLPRYLALKELHIHAGWLDNADLLIKIMINYCDSFTYNEITDKVLSSSNPDRREELNTRLQVMIRKFLSYQYLVID